MGYRIAHIPKANGKLRQLEIPDQQLAEQQRQLIPLLAPLRIDYVACAFNPLDSPFQAVLRHIDVHHSALDEFEMFSSRGGIDLDMVKFGVLCMDLEDFYHHCTWDIISKNLKQYFGITNSQLLNYIESVCMFQGRLPTGAPTSPFLANIAAAALDINLLELINSVERRSVDYYSKNFNLLPVLTITRYADDITVSATIFTPDNDPVPIFKPAYKHVKELLIEAKRGITAIAARHGFPVNKRKTKFFCGGRQPRILGITVRLTENGFECSISRKYRRLVRAGLHNLACGKPAKDTIAQLKGRIAWIKSINPRTADPLEKALTKISAPTP